MQAFSSFNKGGTLNPSALYERILTHRATIFGYGFSFQSKWKVSQSFKSCFFGFLKSLFSHAMVWTKMLAASKFSLVHFSLW